MEATWTKAQHEPQSPWSFTGHTTSLNVTVQSKDGPSVGTEVGDWEGTFAEFFNRIEGSEVDEEILGNIFGGFVIAVTAAVVGLPLGDSVGEFVPGIDDGLPLGDGKGDGTIDGTDGRGSWYWRWMR